MAYRLTCGMWLPLDVRRCFGFFEDPGNLPRITPGWLGFEILTEGIELRAGCLIDYRVRWGVAMRWRTLIEVYEPPVRFVNRQLKGPYKLWHHLHTFREGDGGTYVEDCVTYLPPFGALGRVVNWAAIRRNLWEIFQYRQRRIARLLLGARHGEARVTAPVRIGWEKGPGI